MRFMENSVAKEVLDRLAGDPSNLCDLTTLTSIIYRKGARDY